MLKRVCLLVICLWSLQVFGFPQNDQDLDSLIESVFGPSQGQGSESGPGGGGAGQSGNIQQPPGGGIDISGGAGSGKEGVGGGDGGLGGGDGGVGGGQVVDGGSNGGPQGCECVPYYLCANGTIIDDGVGLLDIRFQGGECGSYTEVCCKSPLPETERITPKPLGHRGCGQRNPDGVGFRITGNLDNEAQYGEFPWMVAILREEELEDGTLLNVYQCGGALIHRQVIITAAHCVAARNASVLKARVGEWDTQTKNELYPHQDRVISHIITHEKYYAGALFNDIALLVVKEPFEYADNVDIICLPKQSDLVVHNECYASGWGKDKFGKEGNYQVILKKVELPIVPRVPCQEALRKTRLGPYFKLHESFICAGGKEGRDTCKGDGGGPLVCPIHGRSYQYQQVGMVAWGIGCGQDEVPAVYVNVAHFRNWIDRHMAKLNFQQEYNY